MKKRCYKPASKTPFSEFMAKYYFAFSSVSNKVLEHFPAQARNKPMHFYEVSHHTLL